MWNKQITFQLSIGILCGIIIIYGGVRLLLVSGVLELNGPTRKQSTGVKVTYWAVYIKGYHELTNLPATDLDTVLDTIVDVTKNDTALNKHWDEKEYLKKKKHMLVDSWGNEIVFHYEIRQNNELWVVVVSKGPDGVLGTSDDIMAERQVNRPCQVPAVSGTGTKESGN